MLVWIKATFSGQEKMALIFLGNVCRTFSVKEKFGMSYKDNLQEKIEKMREKYRAERKTARSDGSDQFVEVKGNFPTSVKTPPRKLFQSENLLLEKLTLLLSGEASVVFWRLLGSTLSATKT